MQWFGCSCSSNLFYYSRKALYEQLSNNDTMKKWRDLLLSETNDAITDPPRHLSLCENSKLCYDSCSFTLRFIAHGCSVKIARLRWAALYHQLQREVIEYSQELDIEEEMRRAQRD